MVVHQVALGLDQEVVVVELVVVEEATGMEVATVAMALEVEAIVVGIMAVACVGQLAKVLDLALFRMYEKHLCFFSSYISLNLSRTCSCSLYVNLCVCYCL